MKRILFILAIAIFTSCSTDSESEREEPADCNCGTIIDANTFSLPTGYVWTVAIIANDCTGAQKQKDLVGRHILGEKICN